MGKKLCADCSAKVEASRQAELAEQRAKEHAEAVERKRIADERARQEELARQARLKTFLENRISGLEALLEQGVTPYLYDSIHIDSQSYFNESPNPGAWNFRTSTEAVGALPMIDQLQFLGWQGWDVVGVIPITFGSTLYNNVGGNTVNAAAYGGLVVGANLLLRLPITHSYLEQNRESVIELLTLEFPG